MFLEYVGNDCYEAELAHGWLGRISASENELQGIFSVQLIDPDGEVFVTVTEQFPEAAEQRLDTLARSTLVGDELQPLLGD